MSRLNYEDFSYNQQNNSYETDKDFTIKNKHGDFLRSQYKELQEIEFILETMDGQLTEEKKEEIKKIIENFKICSYLSYTLFCYYKHNLPIVDHLTQPSFIKLFKSINTRAMQQLEKEIEFTEMVKVVL